MLLFVFHFILQLLVARVTLVKLRQFMQATNHDLPELLHADSEAVEIKALLQCAQQDVTLYEQFAATFELAEPEVIISRVTCCGYTLNE